jgi:glycosyltransferase involved in cell wall biosynthesis
MSLKILHIISQRPDSTGSGFYLQEIMSAAHLAGHENFLISAVNNDHIPELSGVSRKQCSFVDFLPKTENTPQIVGMSDIMPYPSRRFRDLTEAEIMKYLDKFRPPLIAMMERTRFDLIHSHHLWLLSSYVRRLFPELPMVTSCHGSDLRQLSQCPSLLPVVQEGCGEIDVILALSSEQKQQISAALAIPQEKIKVVGAGYNQNIFYRNKTPHTDHRAIVYAGKISRAKGVNWLLQALSQLTLPFHLHLVGAGTGNEYEDCMRLSKLLGDRVTIHGALNQPALAELFNQCSLFVLPSLHEGLPLSVIEALACGCRVIATDLPGTREIKKHIPDEHLKIVRHPVVLDTNKSILADENTFIRELRDSIEK